MKLRQRRTGATVLPLHSGAGASDSQQRKPRRKKRVGKDRISLPRCCMLLCCFPVTVLFSFMLFLPGSLSHLSWSHPKMMKLWDLTHTNPTMFKKLPVRLRLDAEPYTCPDGSVGFRNDDYCDCADGSDEPNTAACADRLVQVRSFPCADGTKHIFPSRVRDGVKDCPDGSDEQDLDEP